MFLLSANPRIADALLHRAWFVAVVSIWRLVHRPIGSTVLQFFEPAAALIE